MLANQLEHAFDWTLYCCGVADKIDPELVPVSASQVRLKAGPADEWIVEMTWPEGRTTGGPVEMRILPSASNSGETISSTLLRDIDFATARDILRRQVAHEAGYQEWKKDLDDAEIELLRDAMRVGVKTDDYRALLSYRFTLLNLRAVEDPTQQLADELGKSRETLRGHLWQAKRRGWLAQQSGPVDQLPRKTLDIIEELKGKNPRRRPGEPVARWGGPVG